MSDTEQSIEKVKKPRTEAQKAAWEKALQARKEKRDERKDVKHVKHIEEKIKQIDVKKEKMIQSLPNKQEELEPEPIIMRRVKKQQFIYVESESESESEPEVIVKSKKPAKRTVAPAKPASIEHAQHYVCFC